MNNNLYQSDSPAAIIDDCLLHGVSVVIGIRLGDVHLIRFRVVPRPVQEVSYHTALPFDLNRSAARERISFSDQNIADLLGDLNPV